MPNWKKVIVSGSDANLNSLNVTNAVTASSFVGDGSQLTGIETFPYTGSAEITGSLKVIGPSSITGSFLVTGSTTQIGNNTLFGNTLLSGSIIISGSLGSVPTVKIYGDTAHNGYIRFDPVSTNINTSISASYIYVSGSTQDLYFSQNGSGYSNVTRLRWLEANLYTGLLHGGLITTQSPTVYQISSGSGIIVELNASLNDDPYPTIQFLEWPNLSASIAPFTASYQQAFVGIDSTNSIYAQGTPFNNGQFNNIINIGNVLFQNQSTINGVKTQPSVAYGFEQAQNTFNRAFGPLKLSGYTLAPSGSSTRSLIVASGTAYAPGSNYSVDPNEPSYTIDPGTKVSKIFRYYQSGSSWVYLTNGGAGYTTIDPTQYSNNGVLTAIPSAGSNWTTQRVFYFPNSVTKAIVVYYGNQVYGTEADAIANLQFETFIEAPNTAANAIYLGAIVIKGTGVFTNPTDYKILPGGLFRQVGGSGGGGSIVTQTLSGLSDVNVSGPTNGQALVYNTTQAKWTNASFISASISGNASTADSTPFATTASYADFASTASNIQGGDQYYIPLWNTDTSLTSSYLYQNNDTLKTFDFGINKGLTLSFLNDEYFLGNTSSSYGGLGTWINVNSGDGVTYINSDNYTIVEGKLGVGITPTNTGLAVSGALEITGPSISKFMSSDVQITGSLDVAGGITGDLTGTASYASQALSSSFATTASYALDADLLDGKDSSTFATTGSNIFLGQQTIQGNILFSGSTFPRIYTSDPTQSMTFGLFDGNSLSGSYFQSFGDSFPVSSFIGSARVVYDIRSNPNADFHVSSYDGSTRTQKFLVNDTGSYVTGLLDVSGGITGSLLGTASYANQALSSSYANQALSSSYAVTASYVEIFPFTGSAEITGSLTVTGSIKSTSVKSNIFINNQVIKEPIYVPSGSNALIIGPVNIDDEIIVEEGGNLYITDFTNPTPNLQAVTDVGSTTTNSITAANFITTSDRRLKSDVKQIENPFEVLGNIKSYEYIKDGKKDAGFIAQEVQETIPYSVFENEEGMLTMSDRPLLAYLYAAVMELKEENKQLKERLGAINNKL